MTTDPRATDRLSDCLRQLLRDDPDIVTDSHRIQSALLDRRPDASREDIDAVCQVAELGIAAQMRELPFDLPVDMAMTRWLEQRLAADPKTDIDSLRRTLEVWAEALDCDVGRALVELIAKDRSLAFDPHGCRRALLEACPSRPFLISLLVRAIDGGIVQEIEKLPDDQTARGAVLNSLEQRLTDSHHRAGTGQWTLHSWLLALGHAVEPRPVKQPADLPWNLFTELLACQTAGVLLFTRLFWNVWARDDMNRYWFGIRNVRWAIGTAIVVAGTAGLFASFIHTFAWNFRGFSNRRTGPGWIRRQTLLSVLCGCAAAWGMLAIEQHLTAEWNTPVACAAGVMISLVVFWIVGKGASLLLLGSYLLVWLIYAFHWMVAWQYDPEHVCLVSNAPGVDGYFVFIVGVAGLSPTLLAGYREWRAWKMLPANHFRKWPDAVLENGPCLSPDGRHYAKWDSAGIITIGDTATRSTSVVPSGHHAAITNVAFSLDGKRIATTSQDMSVRLAAVADGTLMRCLTGHWQTVTCLAWSPDSRQLATGSSDTTIRLWDVSNGACIHTLDLHRTAVTSLCFAGIDRLISGDDEGALRAWSIGDGLETHHVTGKTAVATIQFITARGDIAVRRSDGLEVLNAASMRPVARIAANEFKGDDLTDSAVIPNHPCILISTIESLIAWDYTNEKRRTLSSESPGSIVTARLPDSQRIDPLENSKTLPASEQRRDLCSRVPSKTGTLLLLNAGRDWYRLDASHTTESDLQGLTLSPYTVAGAVDCPSESASGQDGWQNRFENWVQRHSEKPSLVTTCIAVTVVIVGFTVACGLTGSVVAAVSTFAIEWLQHESYESMLDPLGAWNEELRAMWFDSLEQGWRRGRLISLAIATVIALLLIRSDRWARTMTLQCAQIGTLAAVRWFWPVSLAIGFPLIYEKRRSWFECLETFVFVCGPIMLFVVLIGWSCGGMYGAVKTTAMIRITRNQRTRFNELSESFSPVNSTEGLDWLLAVCAFVGVMTVFLGGSSFIAEPVFKQILMPTIFALNGTGTASGRARSTIAKDGPPEAIPVEELLQGFRDSPDVATAEYVGYSFAIRGYLRDRDPAFTLTSPDSMRTVARCVFAAEDAARLKVNSFPESLVDGQRVIVVGTCEGIDSQGLLFFSHAHLHWYWTFHPDEFERRSPNGSAGPPARRVGDDE